MNRAHRHNKLIKEVELYDPVKKTWSIDNNRALPYVVKKYVVTQWIFYPKKVSYYNMRNIYFSIFFKNIQAINCYDWLQGLPNCQE